MPCSTKTLATSASQRSRAARVTKSRYTPNSLQVRGAPLAAALVARAAASGAPLTCNEFGVYRDFVTRAARLRWLADVASVFVEQGIGWTVWDYARDFGVVTGEGGRRRPDDAVLEALGLGER